MVVISLVIYIYKIPWHLLLETIHYLLTNLWVYFGFDLILDLLRDVLISIKALEHSWLDLSFVYTSVLNSVKAVIISNVSFDAIGEHLGFHPNEHITISVLVKLGCLWVLLLIMGLIIWELYDKRLSDPCFRPTIRWISILSLLRHI